MTTPANESSAAPAQDDAATTLAAPILSGKECVDRLRAELNDAAGIVALRDHTIMAGDYVLEHEARVASWDWDALVLVARTKIDEVRRQQGLGAAATAPKVIEGRDGWPQEAWSQLGNLRRTLRLTAGRLVYVEEDLAWYECDDSEIWRKTPAANRDDVAAKWCARAMEAAARLEAAQYDDAPTKKQSARGETTDKSKREKFAAFMEESNKSEMHGSVATQLRRRPEDFGILISKSAFDAKPHELAVANGVLDLRTGKVRLARRDDYISIASPVVYDPQAQAPIFQRYLTEAHPEEDVRAYLQKVLGYGLTGEHKMHQMWIHHGEQGNEGKSLLFKVLEVVMGSHFGAASNKAIVRQRSGQAIGQDMVDLNGRRLLVLNETPEGARLDDEAIKSITSGDTRSDRPHHKANVQHRITGKVHLVTNHLPHVTPDGGMKRRMNVIPWTVSFKDNPDRELEQKLLAELPGILAWLVEGAMAWYADQNLTAPPSVALATATFLGDEDELEQWIADSCVRLNADSHPSGWSPAGGLYQDYASWRLRSGLTGQAMSTTTWGRRMNEKGLGRKETKNGSGGSMKVRPLALKVSVGHGFMP